MSELRDSFIKLFGKTISFPPSQVSGANDCVAASDGSDHNLCSASESEQELGRGQDHSIDQELNKESSKDEQEDATSDQNTVKVNDDNPRTPSELEDLEFSPRESSKNGEEDDKTESDAQDKTLKKPDKILPCPRCNSMDTKFCYYNNYNANQPRHFCKNCQRYWTAGGTMRNVPVGAGRRKNKNAAASHYRHIMVSEALHMARLNAANGIHNPSVLTFGSDSPLGDNNMASSMLNLAEKSQLPVQNGFQRPDQRILAPNCGGKDSGDDHSSGCGSSITASNSSDKVANSRLQEAAVQNYQGFPPQAPCFPGPPWACAWSPNPWNSTLHPAAFSHSAYPLPFYPAPTYWGCAGLGSWNMPLASPPSSLPDNSASNVTPNSTALGKHSRDGKTLNPASSEKEEPAKEKNNSGRSVWIPKTLRIDDPSEAAKSSIRATLGIWNEKTSSMSGGGLFESFRSGNGKDQAMGASAALHANPAAMSRSLNFQENT